MLRCFAAGSQAAKSALCLQRALAAKFARKQLLAAAYSPLNHASILRFELTATPTTRVPPTNAAAVPMESP
jgi:hypothetical protein